MPKPKREYDPLSVIPSADIVRRRLDALMKQARRLRILLRTAEQLERAGERTTDDSNAGQCAQGVVHAD